MAGGVSVSVIGSVVYLVVGLIFGVTIESGPLGAVALRRAGDLHRDRLRRASARGIAIQTGSPQAVQGMFPLLFVLFFLSTMNLPREFIEKSWFRTIAE